MKTIKLHGSLAEHVPGGEFKCEFLTAREAASAIEMNFPGFFDKIRDMSIYLKPGTKQKYSLDESKLVSWKIGEEELHIIPALEGSGGGGGGGGGNNDAKAILGVALIAVAIVGTGGLGAVGAGGLGTAVFANPIGITGLQMLAVGASMVFQAFAPSPPSVDKDDRVKNTVFTGPLNTNKEGDVLPYVAGTRVLAGGVVFNSELTVDHTSTAVKFVPPPPPDPNDSTQDDTWNYGRNTGSGGQTEGGGHGGI